MGMNREPKMSLKNSFILNSSRGFESTKEAKKLYWDKDEDQEQKKEEEKGGKEEEGGGKRIWSNNVMEVKRTFL